MLLTTLLMPAACCLLLLALPRCCCRQHKPAKCGTKAKAGDKVHVHYTGTCSITPA